jgi:hypothetical protein
MRKPLTLALRITGLATFTWLALAMAPFAQLPTDPEWSPRLVLNIVDAESDQPTAARFSLLVDGEPLEPRWIGTHGLRYVSVHINRHQTEVITYARGTGPVDVPLKPGAKRVRLAVAKGFEYLPVAIEQPVSADPLRIDVKLQRWSRVREEGWLAADAHVHYDRPEPSADRDWFHAMDADGLSHAQFMMLKHGMRTGVWARQYAYGKPGEGTDGERVIIPGEEYRDGLQGHLLLFGVQDVIQPIMAGVPDAPENYPLFSDVLRRAHEGGGLVGAAHGATLGGSTTGIVDAVLGSLDFWEIGNAHLWELDLWYRLMNCGVMLPPAAGTDLPNNPYREAWQPFLGSMRMYVKLPGSARGSDAWNAAVKRGNVFATSGPMISLKVNGAGPGETVSLPAGGGEVSIEAELSSPRDLRFLELVSNGRVVALSELQASGGDPDIKHRVIRRRRRVNQSTWFAARGVGARIEALHQDAVAHTAAVKVIVGDQPVRSAADAKRFIEHISEQKEFYRRKAKYSNDAQRQSALAIFDKAIEAFRERTPATATGD